MKTLTIMLSIASVIVIIGMLLGLYRGIKGPDGASRVAVDDLIFYGMLSVVGFIGIHNNSSILFDTLMIGGLFGAVSTIALSRVINRGHR